MNANTMLRWLKRNKKHLSRQQLLTIRGQILAGDLAGAEKGIHTMLERRKAAEGVSK